MFGSKVAIEYAIKSKSLQDSNTKALKTTVGQFDADFITGVHPPLSNTLIALAFFAAFMILFIEIE